MADINDDNDPIEDFFRNKIRDYDITYRESDWMQLEDRLDILDRQQFRRTVQGLAAAALILLISVFGYFIYQNSTQIKQISESLEKPSAPITENSPKPETDATVDRGRDSKNGSSETTPVRDKEKRKTTAQDQSPAPVTGTGLRTTTVSVENGNRPASGVHANADKTRYEKLFVANIPCPDCKLNPTAKNIPASGPDKEAYVRSTTGIPPAYSADISQGRTFSSFAEPAENRESRNTAPRLTFGVLASPDLSTVGSASNFDRPGYRIGFHAEYQLGPNLAISTGLVRSEVNYRAGQGGYDLPYGYGTNSITARETIAECLLLDIPLTLKYDFLHFNRSRLFATAGISSYIMLSEEYRFKYNSRQTGLASEWSGNTGTGHWLSNASISVGYEFDIHENWSLRAEPYVKLPLREVGWANVNLFSMGSYISLNYKL